VPYRTWPLWELLAHWYLLSDEITPIPYSYVLRTMSQPKLRTQAERKNQWIARLIPGATFDTLPHDWSIHVAGDLGLALQFSAGGVSVRSLHDLKLGRELAAPKPAPLFTLGLHNGEGELLVNAEAGWQQTHVRSARHGFVLEWSHPLDERIGPLTVRLSATLDARSSAMRWTLRVTNSGSAWGVWRVIFPQIALSKFDEHAVVLLPNGPGELKRGAWDEAYTYQQPYGQAWCTMQLLAAYAETTMRSQATGLYLAVHDPHGSTKDISAQSDPPNSALTLAYDTPAPNMGLPGNGFTFSGEAVWQLLRGDWYDAAQIYRAWASQHARWWPKLGPAGRSDTPAWMRELSAWVQAGFVPGTTNGLAPSDSLAPVKRFHELVDVPVALHWYAWHQIPFDNDYPHYFPAKEGFAEAVRELQQTGVYIMPYINGRLWDTRDHGTEDFEFSALALPAATKDEHGEPYTESYGSKEADNTPVKLAVMCPTTKLWQTRVHDIVMRLINEVGVDSVYIDQVAAAKPTLCMDATHEHPLGGGHWWNEGYYQMIGRIQAELPEGRMITTECNAEAFIPWFDGYLTWHWQLDNMVPVFPAIYGGTVQTFGRAYDGNALAKRMKAGQQLVFGEQIGWFNPAIIEDPSMADYLRQVIRLRHALRRYFYAGRMLRPPQLSAVPQVKADWQFALVSGDDWVTTDAVMSGAWALPGERRAVLLSVNVSDEPVTATFDFDAQRDLAAAGYDKRGAQLRARVLTNEPYPTTPEALPARRKVTLTFPARQAMAWEVSW
jgi:hypothetical protein